VIAADPELAARMASDQLVRGSLAEAERYLALAARALESVSPGWRGRSQVVLAVVRMRLARQRGDIAAVAEEAERLLAPAVTVGPGLSGPGLSEPILSEPGLGEDLRTLALINLGAAELWTSRLDEAGRHLADGIALVRQIGRPLSGGRRPGQRGAAGQLAILPGRGAAQPGGGRAGRPARLGR
jgi:LuxR family maltose regulon positive regulatory protein